MRRGGDGVGPVYCLGRGMNLETASMAACYICRALLSPLIFLIMVHDSRVSSLAPLASKSSSASLLVLLLG